MNTSQYSAVIIARNEEKYIKKSISSLLNQSIKPYRIVVVDDESTDATLEILSKMPVTVKRIIHKKYIPGDTHAEIRNAGFALVKDDPVDWVYSGDADIILPPRYCENIMKHCIENNAYIGSGTIHKPVELPMDGCRMLRHEWFKSIGMKTKWESIYLCIMALADGKNTLVRHADDCRVTTRIKDRTMFDTWMQIIISKRMGASVDIQLYLLAIFVKRYGFYSGLKLCKELLHVKVQVPKNMACVYRILSRRYFLGRFGRYRKMIDRRNDNLICQPVHLSLDELNNS